MGAPTGTVAALRTKPWRGYPSVNAVHAVRAHIQQDQTKYVSAGLITGSAQGLGHFALTPGVAVHIGTIPAGAIILPVAHHILTLFPGTTPTLDVGTTATPGGILAAVALGATGFTGGVTSGTMMGYQANTIELYIKLTVAGGTPATGEVDVLVPFYIQKD